MKRPQGDLTLLESDLTKRLFASTIPARFAYEVVSKLIWA